MMFFLTFCSDMSRYIKSKCILKKTNNTYTTYRMKYKDNVKGFLYIALLMFLLLFCGLAKLAFFMKYI